MIQSIDHRYPEIPSSAYIHPTADVIGDVILGEEASIWPNAVLRGDLKQIIVGNMTNIQDGSILHTGKYKLEIADRVSVGHHAMLHSCVIGEGSLIGMAAIVSDASEVGAYCIIGEGTVIPNGKIIPPRSVVVGNPYKIIRQVTDEEIEQLALQCEEYIKMAKLYKRTGNIL